MGLLFASGACALVRGKAGELERDDAGVGSAFAIAFMFELVVAPLDDVLSDTTNGPGCSYGYGWEYVRDRFLFPAASGPFADAFDEGAFVDE